MISTPGVLHHLVGSIRQINPWSRELTLGVDDALRVFAIPPDCCIFVNGERVKLRLLQPMDRALISYLESEGNLMAQSIRVGWQYGVEVTGDWCARSA